jgi:hypothetical protein
VGRITIERCRGSYGIDRRLNARSIADEHLVPILPTGRPYRLPIGIRRVLYNVDALLLDQFERGQMEESLGLSNRARPGGG